MQTTLYIITILILGLHNLSANSMLGKWSLDADATIGQWKSNGLLQAESEQELGKKEKLLRTKLFTPLEITVTPEVYRVSGEKIESKFAYTIERAEKDWIIFSAKTEEGIVYALWRFIDSETVYSTNGVTGDFGDLQSSKHLSVYVRKPDVNQATQTTR